ncbi:hypothetical protein AB1286_30005 [Trinickia sp. NRRL B-1857]|uniref:hypothetical protein n=1 Tax=Trinickia sp. NRRL B-1857 TaxID=3162879 RepID=UPI003D2727D8
MRASDHLLDLGRPVAYYPGLVKHFGSVNAVLFFAQIFYWQDKATSEFGVYKTVEEIETETGMTYREQVTARKQLVEQKVLIETHKRFEHRIYYRIDVDRLNEILQFANCGKRISGHAENAAREVRNPQVGNKTEITTETTSLSRAKEIDTKFEEAWRLYPKREGGSVKKTALKAWNARMREGIDPHVLIAAVKGYAKAMERAGNIGTRFVKQASTFFGPDGHFEEYAPKCAEAPDLLSSASASDPWWARAGFDNEWSAMNAGATERSAGLWRDGRPIRKIAGANVEPWPEATA